MPSHSHYDILEIDPGADEASIRRAYRRLAMRYHPDKNPQNAWAAQYFLDIKEAYETLIDPLRRQAYHYQMGGFKTTVPLNPAAVLASLETLVQQLRRSNPYGVNKDLLLHRLSAVFTGRLLMHLQNDAVVAEKLLGKCLQATQWLGTREFRLFQQFLNSHELPAEASALLTTEAKRRRQQQVWQTAWPWLLAAAVGLLCWGIAAL